MTRINLVDPGVLTDKHLMAEYRELPRVFTAVLKLQSQGKTPADVKIPESYKLGTGHVKFFYNKICWLERRYSKLYGELIQRGFDLDRELYQRILKDAHPISHEWYNEWLPTPEEIYINMYRLTVRHFNADDVLFEGK